MFTCILYNAKCDAVTEREIQCGMLQSSDPSSTSFCITRHITDLTDRLCHQHAHKFIDIVRTTDSNSKGFVIIIF